MNVACKLLLHIEASLDGADIDNEAVERFAACRALPQTVGEHKGGGDVYQLDFKLTNAFFGDTMILSVVYSKHPSAKWEMLLAARSPHSSVAEHPSPQEGITAVRSRLRD